MNRVVILAGKGDTYKVLYHALKERCAVSGILLETENNSWRIFKRRLKRLGVIKTNGQVLFKLFISPWLKLETAKRVKEIKTIYNLSTNEVPAEILVLTRSVNDFNLVEFIKSHRADVVILAGTRILSKSAISQISVPIWNIHAGVTPAYRGVHGGYWAIANDDVDHFGVSLHHVDPGIDSGEVIARKIISPNGLDNFNSYPWLQLGEGVELLKSRLQLPAEQKVEAEALPLPSNLWSHPTIWEYCATRLKKRIK